MGNPNRDALEKNLASLENAKYCKLKNRRFYEKELKKSYSKNGRKNHFLGRVFTSGLGAISCVVRLLKHGDHIVAAQDVFGGNSSLGPSIS